MAGSELDTGRSILQSVLERANELGVGASDLEGLAKQSIQVAYINLIASYPWSFARKQPPAVLSVEPEASGTVTVTSGQAQATLLVAPAVSYAGRKMRFAGDLSPYRVLSHAAGQTTLTLDSAYIGSSGAVSFSAVKDEYDLDASFLAPVSQEEFFLDLASGNFLSWRHTAEGLADAGIPGDAGDPTSVLLIGARAVRLSPPPESARRYEYRFIYHPGELTFDGSTSTDVPIIVPEEHRIILVMYGVSNLLVDSDDDRASVFIQAAESVRKDMLGLENRKVPRPRRYVPNHSLGNRR